MDNKMIKLDEQKKIILDMMDEIDCFCLENGISYSLAYGTLLGAIRHKGFIPWDDDFDIIMPRKDYEKFIQIFNKSSKCYQVVHFSNNDSYYYPFAKVVDTRTVLEEKNVTTPMSLGVYIDVFPLDVCGDNIEVAYSTINKKIKKWIMLNTVKLMDKKKKRPVHKQIMVYILKILTKPISWKMILGKINEIGMMYSNYDDSKYSAATTVMQRKEEIVRTDLYKATKRIKFENHMYFVPEGYDEILKSWYGDYMVLPPESQRVTPHHYKAYWK